MATPALETCANCHRNIGSLETPQIYADHVVCSGCYARLSAKPPAAATPIPAYVAPYRAQSPQPHSHQGRFLDPAANAKTALTFFRVFFWIIVGAIIVYMVIAVMASK